MRECSIGRSVELSVGRSVGRSVSLEGGVIIGIASAVFELSRTGQLVSCVESGQDAELSRASCERLRPGREIARVRPTFGTSCWARAPVCPNFGPGLGREFVPCWERTLRHVARVRSKLRPNCLATARECVPNLERNVRLGHEEGYLTPGRSIHPTTHFSVSFVTGPSKLSQLRRGTALFFVEG